MKELKKYIETRKVEFENELNDEPSIYTLASNHSKLQLLTEISSKIEKIESNTLMGKLRQLKSCIKKWFR